MKLLYSMTFSKVGAVAVFTGELQYQQKLMSSRCPRCPVCLGAEPQAVVV